MSKNVHKAVQCRSQQLMMWQVSKPKPCYMNTSHAIIEPLPAYMMSS